MDIESKSVLLIQRVWRGILVRRRMSKLHASALKVQRMVRGHISRKHLGIHRAAYQTRQRIQKTLQMVQERIRTLENTKKTLSVISGTRLDEWETQRRVKAAITLQSHWKGRRTRRALKQVTSIFVEEKQEPQLEKEASWIDSHDIKDIIRKVIREMKMPRSEKKWLRLKTLSNMGLASLSSFGSLGSTMLSKDTLQLEKNASESLIGKFHILDSKLKEYYGCPNDRRNDPESACRALRLETEKCIHLLDACPSIDSFSNLLMPKLVVNEEERMNHRQSHLRWVKHASLPWFSQKRKLINEMDPSFDEEWVIRELIMLDPSSTQDLTRFRRVY